MPTLLGAMGNDRGPTLLVLSLATNVAVLVPVVVSLVRDAGWVRDAYGPKSPARGILLAIYVAILVVSVLLLFRPDVHAALGLLTVQIVYKLLTPFTVGSIRNPVVLSNLAIAALHAVTVASSPGSEAPSSPS
ncbi:MAG: hypothetical protein U0169_04685 [Polyangiaceae bacterium]